MAGTTAALVTAVPVTCADRARPAQEQANPCDSVATQAELTACRLRAAQRAEALETKRYAEAVKVLSARGVPGESRTLEAAERQWKEYRDAECEAASALFKGGSAEPMIAADCRARLATQRAAELQVVYLAEGAR